MSLTISDDELQSAGMSAAEFRREVAVLLFQQERMTLAQAARFSGMGRLQFQRLIADRGLCVHYDVADFEQDLRVTIQALGWKFNGKYQPLTDDIASVAFWYQMEPHNPFPKLPSKDDLGIH